MLEVSGYTARFNAIQFVRALQEAAGFGLKEGLSYVDKVISGKKVNIRVLPGISEERALERLRSSGAIAHAKP